MSVAYLAATLDPRYLLPLAPFIPFATRGVIYFLYRSYVTGDLNLSVEYRAANRSFILTLAGFSFTALLALSVVDAQVPGSPLQLPVYYLLISFLCYFIVMNLQKYPYRGWTQQVDSALIETASLAFLLAVATIIASASDNSFYNVVVPILAVGVWVADHVIEIVAWVGYWRRKKIAQGASTQGQGSREVAGG